MTKLSKKALLIPTSALVLTVALISSARLAQAQSSTAPVSPLARRIAEKFNLNVNEVNEVFVEYKDEMQADREAKMLDKFDQLVGEGKLTEAQKSALVDKLTELREYHEAEDWKSLSHEQRRKKMEEKHQELKGWAEEQGINLDEVMPKVMFRGKIGEGHGHEGKFHFKLSE